MSSTSVTLDALLDDVREDVLVLIDEASDRAVLEAIVREGAPLFLAYKTRNIMPDARSMQRIATYILSLCTVIETARTIRRHERKQE